MAFQVGPFQTNFQQEGVAPVVVRPTGGWEKYHPPFEEESAEERRKRILEERIRRGIVEKPPEKPPEKPEVESFDRLDVDALESGIDLARVELKLIEAEIEKAFPAPKAGMSDKEVRERLLYALEYARKRRVALLLLLI